MKNKWIVAVVVLTIAVFVIAAPIRVFITNTWSSTVQKVDDATRYETKKEVEDSCRSMIASYESDRMVYEQYRDSDSEEQQNWAQQAKMRANKTAASYNNYVLKNSFVWEDNIPADICQELAYLE